MTDQPPIRVLLVDDHPVVREGLKTLLGIQPDIEIVGEAGSGREALAVFGRLRPDVTLMDLRLPDVSGTDVILALRKEWQGARILVLSSYGGDADIRSAMDAGAAGYVVKNARREELFAAIRCVACGGSFVSRFAVAQIAGATPPTLLTDRERQVLELIVEGRSNDEISRAMGLSVGTVKTHVHSILGKLEVKDRTAAVAVALRRGLVRSRP